MIISSTAAYHTFTDMFAIINRGQGSWQLNKLPERLRTGIIALFSQGFILRHRRLTSIFHSMVAWGFIFYLLVNLVDILEGMVPGFYEAIHHNIFANFYRLAADVLTIGILTGTVYLTLRRFTPNPRRKELTFRDNVTVYPHAREAIFTASGIVLTFILLHVGFRFMSVVFLTAIEPDAWQPFATFASGFLPEMSEAALMNGWRVSWWIALGLILIFLPYFPYTKHAHLFMGPLNFMTRRERPALGALHALNFEDEEIEQFGVTYLTDLHKSQLLDAYACIMCNRCQDACPAYHTGKELSPAAVEVNKRYFIKEHSDALAAGEELDIPMMDFVMSASALWACTSCGACVEVCPVGNEPMLDILDMRRGQVLMENEFPHELQSAFEGMERLSNPWGTTESRVEWTKGLDFHVPTVEENPDFEYLFWVGCAGAFDPSAQKVAQAVATILQAAGVSYAILGEQESCTGDSARRAGNEYLFFEMASANIELLNEIGANEKRIVASCPHCFTTIGKEYAELGGHYHVLHHTQMISDLVGKGKLKLNGNKLEPITFHDPCYLGRHNKEYDAPRDALAAAGATLLEMDRSKENSFCCGAGGAQMWKEEEHGDESVNVNRFNEAAATGAQTVAVGCPFCAVMMNDAKQNSEATIEVKDIAQIVAEAL
ncbi:MAG TPA: heterodisulfide reductase-related iron-sulfur binding cluster [Anaerolineae bacterium]|nr:heterodisulfide reductase-related iron-sulfur binding cluster [Anaerolineae bacterium]